MRCPEVKGIVTLRSNAPCTAGAIGPYQNLSYGFNIRLREAERLLPEPGSVPVVLTSAIVQPSKVPLVWDVDGAEAAARDAIPLFSGPSLDSPQVFAGDRYWFPGLRHNREANFAFTDGHVGASARPLAEQWNWSYSPVR
jgi:prepilin-type processing-associated H-X9-DG protein